MKLEELLNQEKTLRFKSFTNLQALEFAKNVEDIVTSDPDKPVAVRVTLDGQTILDYRTTGRKGSGWLDRKVKTVLEAQHSSMYVFLNKEQEPFKGWQDNLDYAVCGGGFPLYINDELRGVLAVSGLSHEDDHRVLTTSLKEVLTPAFHKN